MIDKELFLDLLQNHHHRGDYTDGKGNFCLMGALSVALGTFNADQNKPSFDREFITMSEKLAKQIAELTNSQFISIADFNDDELQVSHEDIMLVAKKAVEEL